MNTSYFYRSFLKKVRPHLGEPAYLTGQDYLHMNSPLVFQLSNGYLGNFIKKESFWNFITFQRNPSIKSCVILNFRWMTFCYHRPCGRHKRGEHDHPPHEKWPKWNFYYLIDIYLSIYLLFATIWGIWSIDFFQVSLNVLVWGAHGVIFSVITSLVTTNFCKNHLSLFGYILELFLVLLSRMLMDYEAVSLLDYIDVLRL